MAKPTPGAALDDDFRLADFKLLLPLGEDVRALVIETAECAFAQHLGADVAQLDQPQATASPPRDDYDLVFTEQLSAARYLRPGGWLCLLRASRSAQSVDTVQEAAGLQSVGRWRAYPDWPAFRGMIPETPGGWRAASRALRFFPWRSPLGIGARLWPGLAAHWLPTKGIAIYQRPGQGLPTLLTQAASALDEQGASDLSNAPMAHWLLVSGRLGPGNPILAFMLDGRGLPNHLIKVARECGAIHLKQEAEQLAAISEALTPRTSAKVISPTARALVDGRWVLAYAYAPTRPFFGLRWHLQGRSGFCLAMADWLADLAKETTRSDEAAAEAMQRVPLRRLIARRILPLELQRRAEAALSDLEMSAPEHLPLVLEHGDLGIYNVRLSRADGSDFRVLDWGSSTFSGIPVGDLGYLLCSARASRGLARRCLLRYLDQTGLSVDLMSACWFAYLARRWEELDSIRPPRADDPTSGGGLLRPIAERMATYLDSLGAKP